MFQYGQASAPAAKRYVRCTKMKITEPALYSGILGQSIVYLCLLCSRKRIPTIIGSYGLGLSLVELVCALLTVSLVVQSIPFGLMVPIFFAWWWIHIPSAVFLGVDEIVERHGAFLSAVAHFADLLLWTATLSALHLAVSKAYSRGKKEYAAPNQAL
jgi:hypothetical protein